MSLVSRRLSRRISGLNDNIKSAIWWIPLSRFGWILGIYLMVFTGEILNPVVEFLKSTGIF
jgi:hypothetical protein